jgi:hypothetical protein
MSLIDDLTQELLNAVTRDLRPTIERAVKHFLLGNHDKTPNSHRVIRKKGTKKKKVRKKGRKASIRDQENREKVILAAVQYLGSKSNIETVAKRTGFDKRGVGSSLHYLSVQRKIKKVGNGRYRP